MRRHCSSSVLLPCVALALLLAACGQSSAALPPTPTPTATATATVTPAAVTLPAFADWRVAYVDASDYLHAVSLDGKTDLAGPQLAGLTANGTGVVAAGFSPDGHLLAYAGDTYTAIVDVTGREATGGLPAFAATYNMFWSPDGSDLERDDNEGNIVVEHLPDGKLISLAHAAGLLWFRTAAIGWIDTTHLTVEFGIQNSSVPTLGLGSINVSTGQIRTLAIFSSPSLGNGSFSLSPDGKKVLFYNHQFRSDPFVVQVDEIDTGTGVVTPLPWVTRLLTDHGDLGYPVWRPGTQTVAAFIESGSPLTFRNWLFDLAHHTATPIAFPSADHASFPVGWAPDGGPLILSTGYQSGINSGPFQLTAVSFAADGTPSATVLTKDAYTFTFLGFVKTA